MIGKTNAISGGISPVEMNAKFIFTATRTGNDIPLPFNSTVIKQSEKTISAGEHLVKLIDGGSLIGYYEYHYGDAYEYKLSDTSATDLVNHLKPALGGGRWTLSILTPYMSGGFQGCFKTSLTLNLNKETITNFYMGTGTYDIDGTRLSLSTSEMCFTICDINPAT